MPGTALAVPAEAALPARPAAFRAGAARDWAEVAADWAAPVSGGTESAFQRPEWLGAFYRAVAAEDAAEPLLVTLTEVATGDVAMRLPLVRLRRGGRRVIEFADLDLTDYNAPLLGPAAPTTAADAKTLWRSLRGALPPADLIRLAKMPATIGGRPNPLALLAAARPSALTGHPLTIGEDFTAYRFGLPRTFRKELERSWRVFTRHPEAELHRVADRHEAIALLAEIAEQQKARMTEAGADYRLDSAFAEAFYRDLVATGIESGYVVMTALRVGTEIVAGLLGVRQGDGYVMIRIANAGAAWSNCSPGRLIIMETMRMLHAEGCRVFDFSIGDYDYKRRFGIAALPLVDLNAALSARGLPAMLRARTAAALRERPALDRALRDMLARLKAR